MRCLLLVIILSASCLNVARAVPVAWPTSQGGNDHYYDFIPGYFAWASADAAASARTYQGMQGYLTTITSPAECSFLIGHFAQEYGSIPLGWLGAYQDRGAEDYFEPAHGWRWVTGEAWEYTNWWTDVGFPDNAGGRQDYVRTQGPFLWDDIQDSPPADMVQGYYLEYSPVPTSPVLGDFNANGILDIYDLHMLFSGIRDGSNFVFDLDPNHNLDHEDRRVWVEDLKRTYFGDANLDGQFTADDMVMVFQAGKYEDGKPRNAEWEEGDWNGDADFDTSDMVLAFQGGGYEKGPRSLAVAVPEPSPLLLLSQGLMGIAICRRRPRS